MHALAVDVNFFFKTQKSMEYCTVAEKSKTETAFHSEQKKDAESIPFCSDRKTAYSVTSQVSPELRSSSTECIFALFRTVSTWSLTLSS